MTILLTGAGGFVGRHIQQQVACRPLNLDGAPVDLRKREQVHETIRKIRPDVVLHVAAISSHGKAGEQARNVFDVNFIGTFNLLVALKRHRILRHVPLCRLIRLAGDG